MVRLVVSGPTGEPVDLVAMGGAVWMTLDGDGRFVLTTQNPGDPARIAETGGLTRVLAGRCAPSRPVPVLAFHGTSDGSVPYSGNSTVLSVPATLEFWASADGCGGAVIEPVADVSDDGTVVSRTRHATCAAGSEVVLYTIERGGHTWPGSPMPFSASLGPVCRDVSASQLMLEFFSRHPLLP